MKAKKGSHVADGYDQQCPERIWNIKRESGYCVLEVVDFWNLLECCMKPSLLLSFNIRCFHKHLGQTDVILDGGRGPRGWMYSLKFLRKYFLLPSRYGKLIEGDIDVTELKSMLTYRHKLESNLTKQRSCCWMSFIVLTRMVVCLESVKRFFLVLNFKCLTWCETEEIL